MAKPVRNKKHRPKSPKNKAKPKVVHTDLEKHRLLLLSTRDLVDRYWGQCVPHIEKSIAYCMAGEITCDEIYSRITEGSIYAIITKDDEPEVPDVSSVLTMELITHANFSSMNIITIGSIDLDFVLKKHWEDICSWAKVCGVRSIGCTVSKSIERMLTGYNLKPVSTVLKRDLLEV